MIALATVLLVLGTTGAACQNRDLGADAGPPPAGRPSALFIGNSLTDANDLPRAFAELAASTGDSFYVRSVTLPDFALNDHWRGGSDAVRQIRLGGWEFVVLQQGPSSLPVNRDSLIIASRLFNSAIREIGATPALYMVWPSVQRRAFFDDVRLAYEMAAREIGGVFLPAGQAWVAAWRRDSSLSLYAGDGFHPSRLGTYVAALVIYERLTGRDARSLPPRVGGTTLGVTERTARLLQEAAHEANGEFPVR